MKIKLKKKFSIHALYRHHTNTSQGTIPDMDLQYKISVFQQYQFPHNFDLKIVVK